MLSLFEHGVVASWFHRFGEGRRIPRLLVHVSELFLSLSEIAKDEQDSMSFLIPDMEAAGNPGLSKIMTIL